MLARQGSIAAFANQHAFTRKLTQDLSKFTRELKKRSRTTRGERKREKERKLCLRQRQVSMGQRHVEGLLRSALIVVFMDRLVWSSIWLYAWRNDGGVSVLFFSQLWKNIVPSPSGWPSILAISLLPVYVLLVATILIQVAAVKKRARSILTSFLFVLAPIGILFMACFCVWYIVFLYTIAHLMRNCYPQDGAFAGTGSQCEFSGNEANVWNDVCAQSGGGVCFRSVLTVYVAMRHSLYIIMLGAVIVILFLVVGFFWSISLRSAIHAERATQETVDQSEFSPCTKVDHSPVSPKLASPTLRRTLSRQTSMRDRHRHARHSPRMSPRWDDSTRSPRLSPPSDDMARSPRIHAARGSRMAHQGFAFPPPPPMEVVEEYKEEGDLLWGCQFPPRKESQISQHSL